MLRPNFSNIILCLLIKYLAFYAFMMIKNDEYRLLEAENLKEGHSLAYFFYVMLPLPILCMLLFSAPIYYSFRLKKSVYFFSVIPAVLVAEYFLYVFFTTDKHIDMNGIYNAIFSVLFLLVFFFKKISLIISGRKYDHTAAH